jgi:hypothetical protein
MWVEMQITSLQIKLMYIFDPIAMNKLFDDCKTKMPNLTERVCLYVADYICPGD